MSVYYIKDGELYHHGVKGMKWGVRKARRLENRAVKKYGRAARRLGEAQYERDKGAEEYKKHDDSAKVFDKAAKKYEREGSYFRAEASRKAAAALRARGENVKRQRDETAASLEKRAEKLTQFANSYAAKKAVNLGKKRVDSIFSEQKKKGYENQKAWDEWQKDEEMRERLGENGYDIYNRLRGLD